MTSEEKEQLDIQWLYRGENLWQFRIAERTPHYHTKSFSDSGRHSDVSLEEARTYRNAYLAAHPQLHAIRPPVWSRLPKHNRTGILGVNYSTPTLPSGTVSPTWQMTCPKVGGGTPKTASFSVREHGETCALLGAVTARRDATLELLNAANPSDATGPLKRLIGDYDDIIAELQESLATETESEVLTIVREARIDATSKQAEISVRLGQHRFRRLVLARWDGRCAVTDADILVDASHIKPWIDASHFDRINPDNGLPLAAHYHRAFDLGYITFADDGAILASPAYRDQLSRIGIDLSARLQGILVEHHPFLLHHRERVFRNRPMA